IDVKLGLYLQKFMARVRLKESQRYRGLIERFARHIEKMEGLHNPLRASLQKSPSSSSVTGFSLFLRREGRWEGGRYRAWGQGRRKGKRGGGRGARRGKTAGGAGGPWPGGVGRGAGHRGSQRPIQRWPGGLAQGA